MTGSSRRFATGLALLAGAGLAGLAVLNARAMRRAERNHPPHGRFVDVDGVRLHYLDLGHGDPLVLIHGNGSMVEDFESSGLIDMARTRHRVIAFDRPGFGHSERPRTSVWTHYAQAELIFAALQKLGVGPATVLGHSWGCSVALALAERHPQSVKSLVLASGYYFPSLRVDVLTVTPPALPVIGDVLRHTISPVLTRLMWPALLRKIFGPQDVPSKFDAFPESLVFRPSQIRASAADSALMIPDAVASAPRYGAVTTPTVIVAGSDDRIVSFEGQSARLNRVLPNSVLKRIAGGGHMIHQTETEAVMAAIDAATAMLARPGS